MKLKELRTKLDQVEALLFLVKHCIKFKILDFSSFVATLIFLNGRKLEAAFGSKGKNIPFFDGDPRKVLRPFQRGSTHLNQHEVSKICLKSFL